ncbi:MAG: FAD-binding protein [Deltaproteobacteria bacterium]|nr:FAD-binding protein [Deltaproteobacteria bacterium]
MPLEHSTLRALKRLLGAENVAADPCRARVYGYDASVSGYPPEAVVFPVTTEQAAGVVRLANERGFFVIPRGAGTGMTGGSVPVQGGVVLCLSRMDNILSIDAANLTADVEPGVVTGRLHREVEKLGLFYPPDPSSSDYCTIGGNVAECAGGPRAVKYGVTRDYVLTMEAVTGAGEVLETGARTFKGVVGFDLTRLIVGSEGTLAVATRVTLRLLPLPRAVRTVAAVFDTMKAAGRAVADIFAAGEVPRAIEFLDSGSLQCAEKAMNAGLPTDAGAVLLMEVDGSPGEADRQAGALAEVCQKSGARFTQTHPDSPEAKKLWAARKAVSPALFAFAPHKINEDVVVPISRIPDLVEKVEALRAETGLTMVSFGHAGDGNIHFNIMLDKSDPGQARKADYVLNQVFSTVISLGGTLSGEHGVGTTKAPYLSMEVSPERIRLMQGIKKVFDPKGVLNPGKIFPFPS